MKNYGSFGLRAPNTVLVNDTLFCDQTEMSNIDWLFYEWGVKKVYGDSLIQHKLLKLDSDGIDGAEKGYLRNPKVRLFPLVSVSLEQAKEFAKWRTRALFTSYTEARGLIPKGTLTGGRLVEINEFFNSHPELKDKLYYFEYRIPTEEEWRLSFKYAIEIELKYGKKHRQLRGRKSKSEAWEIENGLSNVLIGNQVAERRNPILKMNENVSEIILEEGYSMGGNYFEKDPEGIKNKFERPNAWTGFRCVGSWKKWGE